VKRGYIGSVVALTQGADLVGIGLVRYQLLIRVVLVGVLLEVTPPATLLHLAAHRTFCFLAVAIEHVVGGVHLWRRGAHARRGAKRVALPPLQVVG